MNTMNKKLLSFAAVPVLAFSLMGAATTSAHGLFGFMASDATPEEIADQQTESFNRESTILGISVDDIKNAWAEGKDLRTLAEEKGISEESIRAKMKELRSAEIETRLKTLVQKGVITQAQADKRLTFEKKMLEEGPGKGFRGGHRGGFGGPGMGMMDR